MENDRIPRRTRQSEPQVKLRLGDHYTDVQAMADRFNMKMATFCAYTVRYFVENFDGRALPPLKDTEQRNLDL